MTNQLTPQHGISPMKLLEIAREVYPDKNWVLCGFGRDVISTNSLGHVTIFEPHNPTERGQAQLMKVVFALLEKSSEMHLYRHKGKIRAVLGMDIYSNDQKGIGKTKADAILSLAHEVLCNAD